MQNSDQLNFNKNLKNSSSSNCSNFNLNQNRIFGKDITNKNKDSGFQVNGTLSILNSRSNFMIPESVTPVNNFLQSTQNAHNVNLPKNSSITTCNKNLPGYQQGKNIIRVNRVKNQSMDDNILKLNIKNPLLQPDYEKNNHSKIKIPISINEEIKFKENVNEKPEVIIRDIIDPVSHKNNLFLQAKATMQNNKNSQKTNSKIDKIIKNNLYLQNQRNSVNSENSEHYTSSGLDLKYKETNHISESYLKINNLDDSNIHMKTVESDEKCENKMKTKEIPENNYPFDIDETLKIFEEETYKIDRTDFIQNTGQINYIYFSHKIDTNIEYSPKDISIDEGNINYIKINQYLNSPLLQSKISNTYPENKPDLKSFKDFTFNNWKKVTVDVEAIKKNNLAVEETNKNKFKTNIHLEKNMTQSCLYNPEPHLEYLDEIYFNLLQEESECNFKIDYLKYQSDLNDKMRIILMEWLYEVVLKFKLKLDTYFLTVCIIDQFLVKGIIKRNHYQLLAASALLIACKFEEIYFPEIKDLVYICDKAFSEDLIIQMESEILKYLNYKIFPIFPQRYLQIIALKLNLTNFDINFCLMMLELFTFDYKMINYPPSLIACTCVYIALKIKKINAEKCNHIIENFLNFNLINKFEMEKQLKLCAQNICALLDNLDIKPFRMIKEKYSKKEFDKVAQFKVFM